MPTGPSAALAQLELEAQGTAIDQTCQCIGDVVTCDIFRGLKSLNFVEKTLISPKKFHHWNGRDSPIDVSSCGVAIYSALEISSANAFLFGKRFKKNGPGWCILGMELPYSAMNP